jgi:hypothetical protein
MTRKPEAVDWEAEMDKSLQRLLKTFETTEQELKPIRSLLETFRTTKAKLLAQGNPEAEAFEKLCKEYGVQTRNAPGFDSEFLDLGSEPKAISGNEGESPDQDSEPEATFLYKENDEVEADGGGQPLP